jgi:hypothetical protein
VVAAAAIVVTADVLAVVLLGFGEELSDVIMEALAVAAELIVILAGRFTDRLDPAAAVTGGGALCFLFKVSLLLLLPDASFVELIISIRFDWMW